MIHTRELLLGRFGTPEIFANVNIVLQECPMECERGQTIGKGIAQETNKCLRDLRVYFRMMFGKEVGEWENGLLPAYSGGLQQWKTWQPTTIPRNNSLDECNV